MAGVFKLISNSVDLGYTHIKFHDLGKFIFDKSHPLTKDITTVLKWFLLALDNNIIKELTIGVNLEHYVNTYNIYYDEDRAKFKISEKLYPIKSLIEEINEKYKLGNGDRIYLTWSGKSTGTIDIPLDILFLYYKHKYTDVINLSEHKEDLENLQEIVYEYVLQPDGVTLKDNRRGILDYNDTDSICIRYIHNSGFILNLNPYEEFVKNDERK